MRRQAIKNAPADVPGQQGANPTNHFQYSSKSTINPEEHLGLVGYIVHEYYGFKSPEEFEDLFQEGCIGLVKAARIFDPERGTKFPTLADLAIKGSINSYLKKKYRWDKLVLLLDRPIQQEKGNLTFLDLLEDTTLDFENEVVNRLTDLPALKQALTRLSARELRAVRMRYFENCLQKDIAKEIRVTPKYVSTFLFRSISKLRQHMEVAQ